MEAFRSLLFSIRMARGNSKRTDWSIFRWERSQHHSAIPTAIPAILDARRRQNEKIYRGYGRELADDKCTFLLYSLNKFGRPKLAKFHPYVMNAMTSCLRT